MMWPASQASKILLALLVLIILYCIVMDVYFYIRIQKYPIDIFSVRNGSDARMTEEVVKYDDVTWVPCSVNPLCHPTIKSLMVDHINHYVYGPLCSILDIGLRISDRMIFLTPNMISLSHVCIALIGAKLINCKDFVLRRLGVVLFQIRMFLDDLDGHVARERKNIKGERSEVGSMGYWVDGVSDLIGVTALIIGLYYFLKNNRPRRGYKDTPADSIPYHQLNDISVEDIDKEASDVGVSFKTKVPLKEIVQVLGLFCGQMILSALAWNRYIDVYQEVIENCTGIPVVQRETIFKSNFLFTATGLWRIVNPHSYLHLLALAIFCDKTWGFLKTTHFIGYLGVVIAAGVSEFFVMSSHIYQLCS